MFENISKGQLHLPHFARMSKEQNCDCGFLFCGEDATTIGCLYHNKHEGNIGEDDYPEKEEAIANAEFIAFCFNLQQRYDISKLEEAVKLFERLLEQNMCSVSGDQAIEQLLKQIKK